MNFAEKLFQHMTGEAPEPSEYRASDLPKWLFVALLLGAGLLAWYCLAAWIGGAA